MPRLFPFCARSLHLPSPASVVALMVTMHFHVYLMQKASAFAYVTSLEGMVDLCRRKGEAVDQEIAFFISFWKLVGVLPSVCLFVCGCSCILRDSGAPSRVSS